MYCEKCGNYVPDGQLCACQQQQPQQPQYAQGGYSAPAAVPPAKVQIKPMSPGFKKVLVVILAVLAMVFHFTGLVYEERDFDVSSRDAKEWAKDVAAEEKEFDEGEAAERYNLYNLRGESGYANMAYDLMWVMYIAFAVLLIVTIVPGENGDKARLYSQTAFFVLMALVLILMAIQVGSMDNSFDSYDGDPYELVAGLAYGWWLTAITTVAGLALTITSAKKSKKA